MIVPPVFTAVDDTVLTGVVVSVGRAIVVKTTSFPYTVLEEVAYALT